MKSVVGVVWRMDHVRMVAPEPCELKVSNIWVAFPLNIRFEASVRPSYQSNTKTSQSKATSLRTWGITPFTKVEGVRVPTQTRITSLNWPVTSKTSVDIGDVPSVF